MPVTTSAARRTAAPRSLQGSPLRRLLSRGGAGYSGGFSAAELMAVVALIGMMVLVTAPALLNFFSSMKIRTASHRMMSHLRLCRQVPVSRRTDVVMEIQVTDGATRPEYKAWEEKSGDLVRTANGADGTANTEDDENWVIKRENQMALDLVTFLDAYDDPSPSSPEPPGNSILDGDNKLMLRFSSNGRVALLDTADGTSVPFTMLRLRMQKRITGSRLDTWDATLYPLGKVGSDYTHGP